MMPVYATTGVYEYSELASLYVNANPGVDPEIAKTMAAIAMAESSGNPGAVNAKSGATGLWQVMPSVWYRDADFKSKFPNLKDAATNARAAEYIRNKQGLGAWSTYTSGAYKKYIPNASAWSKIRLTLGVVGLGGPIAIKEGASQVKRRYESAADFLSALPDMLAKGAKVAGIAVLALTLLILGVVIVLRKPALQAVKEVRG